MSRYTLKRISKSVYDDLVNATEDEFKKSEFLKINKDRVTNECEDVIVNGKKIEFDIDVEQINQITGSNNPNYIKNAKIAMILHKNIQDVNGTKIPYNIMNEKEVWSYLNTCIFYEQIKKLYMPKESDVTLDRIRRYYFNIASESKVSRTGFKFLWLMVDKLNSENEEEITRIAFECIDPVRAMFERKITRNPMILRAFVEAIIRNGAEFKRKIKSPKYKSLVPKHINCYAAINMLDAYGYEELVDVLAKEQRNRIS